MSLETQQEIGMTDEPSAPTLSDGHLPTAARGTGWLLAFIVVYFIASFLYFVGAGVYLGISQPGISPEQIQAAIMEHSKSLNGLAGMYLVQFVVLVPLLLWVSNFRNQPWATTLALKVPSLAEVKFWLMVWVIYQIGSITLHSVFAQEESEFLKTMSGSKHLLATLVVIVLAPIMEELFFRGYLFKAWRHSWLGLTGTLLLTSGLFVLMHLGQYGWLGLLQLLVFSLILGLSREKSQSLITPWLLHFVNNLFAAAVIIFMGVL